MKNLNAAVAAVLAVMMLAGICAGQTYKKV
jgi:hypothetical protein